jgi:hypothetical protein
MPRRQGKSLCDVTSDWRFAVDPPLAASPHYVAFPMDGGADRLRHHSVGCRSIHAAGRSDPAAPRGLAGLRGLRPISGAVGGPCDNAALRKLACTGTSGGIRLVPHWCGSSPRRVFPWTFPPQLGGAASAAIFLSGRVAKCRGPAHERPVRRPSSRHLAAL